MAPNWNVNECALMHHVDSKSYAINRGVVVGFVRENRGPLFTYRVIGIAGDKVALDEGMVILNGEPVPQKYLRKDEVDFELGRGGQIPRCQNDPLVGEICSRSVFLETLPDGRSYEFLNLGDTRSDNFDEITVPAGHLFVLGDHRDNAADSRFPRERGGHGLIPINRVRGIFPEL